MAWQNSLQNSISSPSDLTAGLTGFDNLSDYAHQQFPLRIPRTFFELIDPDDPNDPLLKQVFPDHQEETRKTGFTTDPLDEHDHEPSTGILHKYHGRVLLLVTGACAIHCRYCFRRHFPYSDSNPLHSQWQSSLEYLRRHTEVSEVIFSGGDPLTLTDEKLASLIHDLEAIRHLRRLRIHTRIPVVLPDRVTENLMSILTNSRLNPVIVLHVNHPREIGERAKTSIQSIKDAGITLLNQSVLLKGVNDSTEILTCLSETLFDMGVLPYYLHLLDPVTGAAHFEVSRTEAIRLYDELSIKLPGYLVPRLVQEISGIPYKLQVR